MRTVSRECNIRSYTYRAHLTESGRLSRITAGCRTFKTFDIAFAHYRGEGPWGAGWSDARVGDDKAAHARRLEARELLRQLERDVEREKRRIRARNRRRKAKK